MDLKEPSPLVEARIEQQACLGLCSFHEAVYRTILTSTTDSTTTGILISLIDK
ncbi:MAG: hypothetical protein O4965_01625 [Trichodesmium sp. St19_bin1]|nr:hypothetical protein [Trichodesmium sp. St19_bin1]